ncbi:8073_t:CDS:1, partial [Paraglomus occultum]
FVVLSYCESAVNRPTRCEWKNHSDEESVKRDASDQGDKQTQNDDPIIYF